MDRKSLIEPWRVVGHRYSYRDRWLRLRSDRCVTPAGQDVDPFHVLEYHDWINVLALTGGNRCLLVREYRHGVGEIVVGLPGGTMDATDADPETAARRELLEETGFTAGSLIPCGTSFANAATHTNRVWSYIAPDAVRTGGQSLDETEDIEVIEVDLADAVERVRRGTLVLSSTHLNSLWLAVSQILTGAVPGTENLRAALLEGLSARW